jgi:transcriptional regulator with XRE-family HTH domain
MIKLLAETSNTVTLKRTDFDALLRSAEDAVDLTAVEVHRAYEDRVGWEMARRNYLTAEEARRLLNGDSPVRVWRDKRGVKQRALAEAAEVSPSYLAEIEGGKKPGSPGALQRIAGVLDVPLENLTGPLTIGGGLRPMNRSDAAAERLVGLAEGGATIVKLREAAHAVISEWLRIAERDRAMHQVRAAIGALERLLLSKTADLTSQSDVLRRQGDGEAAQRTKRASNGLEAAIDVLDEEYHKH